MEPTAAPLAPGSCAPVQKGLRLVLCLELLFPSLCLVTAGAFLLALDKGTAAALPGEIPSPDASCSASFFLPLPSVSLRLITQHPSCPRSLQGRDHGNWVERRRRMRRKRRRRMTAMMTVIKEDDDEEDHTCRPSPQLSQLWHWCCCWGRELVALLWPPPHADTEPALPLVEHTNTHRSCSGHAHRSCCVHTCAPRVAAPALGSPPGLWGEQGVLEHWVRLAWDGRIEQGHPVALPALCTASPVPRAVLSIKSRSLQPMPGSGSSRPAALSDPSDPFLSPGCSRLLLHVKFISFLGLEKKHFQKASREQCSWADRAAAAPGAPRGSAAPQGPRVP